MNFVIEWPEQYIVLATRTKVRIFELTCNVLYYIKVSGIASGNKLIKTIRYPHM